MWRSDAYGKAHFKLEYVNDTTAKRVIRRRHNSAVNKGKLLKILERMNKIYTKNGNRYNESTDWLHYYYVYSLSSHPRTDLKFYNVDFWETMRPLSLKNYVEADFKKGAYAVYSRETKFGVIEEKDPFLVFDDEEKQHLLTHKTDRVKYYVSVDHFLNRNNKVSKYLPNATYEIRDAQKEFPNTNPDRIEKNVYEELNHTTTAGVISTLEDFILPQTRNAGNNFDYTFLFQNEKWFFKDSGF